VDKGDRRDAYSYGNSDADDYDGDDEENWAWFYILCQSDFMG
jgi:hypothetical protein